MISEVIWLPDNSYEVIHDSDSFIQFIYEKLGHDSAKTVSELVLRAEMYDEKAELVEEINLVLLDICDMIDEIRESLKRKEVEKSGVRKVLTSMKKRISPYL